MDSMKPRTKMILDSVIVPKDLTSFSTSRVKCPSNVRQGKVDETREGCQEHQRLFASCDPENRAKLSTEIIMS